MTGPAPEPVTPTPRPLSTNSRDLRPFIHIAVEADGPLFVGEMVHQLLNVLDTGLKTATVDTMKVVAKLNCSGPVEHPNRVPTPEPSPRFEGA